jgi:hypothetical protein
MLVPRSQILYVLSEFTSDGFMLLIEIKKMSSKRVVHQALSNIIGQSSVGWWNFKICDTAILISLWAAFIYKINDHDASLYTPITLLIF